ncbi:hypothetical protein ZIOFF_012928 [Zingiber officinale]|uniref:glycerophosphodiester phosphodiesterase n=1 Tax=Zingiber officinale TaxID=94328 RepID=A0A8J5H8J1_ZINOF|nr:hypothetical protein ZIOFF_012928 [Zingiber officinale]
MSEVFHGYEPQYCEISVSPSRLCIISIRKMEIEARSLQPSIKAGLSTMLREYKSDINNLKSELKRITNPNPNQAAREELLEFKNEALLGKDPHLARRTDKKGQTALHMAVKGTNCEVVKALLNTDYLDSKKGLGILDVVSSALSNANFDKQPNKQVFIQSNDIQVLFAFKQIPGYTCVLTIEETISDAQKPTNEYLAITFDYFSDPIVEIVTLFCFECYVGSRLQKKRKAHSSDGRKIPTIDDIEKRCNTTISLLLTIFATFRYWVLALFSFLHLLSLIPAKMNPPSGGMRLNGRFFLKLQNPNYGSFTPFR